MKIAVIGGGSTYTPELVNGFLDRIKSLPLDELWLMDIDASRLEIVGGFARRMVAAKGSPFKVVLTTDQRLAVKNATYVTTQIRVGHMPARVADEYLGLRHGLIGQETTGIGGMAKAMRTIPVLLKLAQDMRRTGPRRPAGELHQPLRTGDRGAPALRPGSPFGGRLQCANRDEDAKSSRNWSNPPAGTSLWNRLT